jgi:hypothetical protein
MPTMITVPIGQRTKSIQFGAAYSPSLSFNPDKKLLVGCSGILSGLGITVNTVPNPDQVTVDIGAFIQRGIIVDVVSAQVVEVPASPTFPLYLVAENANEVHNSSVQYLFTTTPNADSVIIAEWPIAPITAPVIPVHISNCGLRDAIGGITALMIQRENIVAFGGQTLFTLPAPKAYVLGSNKLFIYRNGKKLEVNNDYSEDSPTQFTLNFGATAGDVFDIIVFQGTPPITSLALLNLTDVTSDLANAIKDPSVLRAALATQLNPLATLADVSSNQGNPNVLINNGFRFAQRQTPGTLSLIFSSASRGYSADRWGLTSETPDAQYARVDTLPAPEAGLTSRYYGKFQKVTASGKIVIVQPIESKVMEPLRGKTVRFQMKMKRAVAASMTVRLGLVYLTSAGTEDLIPGVTVSAFGAPSVDPTWNTNLVAIAPSNPIGGTVSGLGVTCVLSGGWVNYSASFVVPANAKNLCAAIWSDDALAVSDELHLAEASLHRGASDVEWSPMQFTEELKLCQRYYFKTFEPDQVPVHNLSFGSGPWRFAAPNVASLSAMWAFTTLPVEIRSWGGAQNQRWGVNNFSGAIRDLTNGLDQAASSIAVNGDRFVEAAWNKNAGTSPGALCAIHFVILSEL